MSPELNIKSYREYIYLIIFTLLFTFTITEVNSCLNQEQQLNNSIMIEMSKRGYCKVKAPYSDTMTFMPCTNRADSNSY